eukprot:gb/GFBE01004850.1/.p1 GENE.gb/GFBE01004850.1/~~gb/GFBE01004850.1/.p1  ORF type:complete len:336 (+),score=43.52 gb/GFBE01004850.1/:1-1008(+)
MSSFRAMWTPPRPTRALSSNGMRLPPLSDSEVPSASPVLGRPSLAPRSELNLQASPGTPLKASFRPPRLPKDSARSGHLGLMSSLRRSYPEAATLGRNSLFDAASEDSLLRSDRPDVLLRKPRRTASRGKRGVDAASEKLGRASASSSKGFTNFASEFEAPQASPGSSARAASAPPAGAEQAAKDKARAVSELQRFFFEEVSKGQNANEAAASALRRLKEGSLGAFAGAAGGTASSPEATASPAGNISEDEDEPLRPQDPFSEERQLAAQARSSVGSSWEELSVEEPAQPKAVDDKDEADEESTPEAPAVVPQRPSPAMPRPARRRPPPRATLST